MTSGDVAVRKSTARPVRLLQASALVSSLDRAAIAPLLVPIAADLDKTVDQVTLAATSYLLAYGVMQLFWAAGSGRFGRVRTMRFAMVLAGVAGIASACVSDLELLVILRGVAGAAFAAAVPGALVYIGDTVPIRVRPAALADLVTGIAVGFGLGTLGAAAASEHIDWRFAFAVTGALSLGLAILIGRLPEPEREQTPPMLAQIPGLIRHGSTMLILALGFVEGFVVLGFLVFLPATLQLSGVSTTKAGGVTAVYGVAVVLAAWAVKRSTGRVAPHRVLALGGLAATAAFALLVFAHGPAGVLVAAVLLGISWAQMHTALQAWATEVRPTSRGLVVSAFAACLFMGSAAGTSVGGVMLADGSLVALFGAATTIAALLTVIAVIGRARQPF